MREGHGERAGEGERAGPSQPSTRSAGWQEHKAEEGYLGSLCSRPALPRPAGLGVPRSCAPRVPGSAREQQQRQGSEGSEEGGAEGWGSFTCDR